MDFRAYGTNIKVQPESKNKVIGDTSTLYLYGKVVDVGQQVSAKIAIGDTIGFTLWGLNEIVEADGSKHHFVQDSSDFILGIVKADETTTS